MSAVTFSAHLPQGPRAREIFEQFAAHGFDSQEPISSRQFALVAACLYAALDDALERITELERRRGAKRKPTARAGKKHPRRARR